MDPNKQGQHVSGDEFDNLLRTVVQEEVAKVGQPQGQAQQTQPEPLKLTIGGQEYTFENQAALSAALNQTFAGYSQQMAQLQSQIQETQTQGQHVQSDDEPKFDMKQYIEMMEKDPIKAANYVDSHRYFNGRVENPAEVIRNGLLEAQELKRVVAAYQFKDAHPEYVPTPENAQKIESVRQALNLPATFDGLEAAYATAITKGFIPDPRAEQFRQAQQQQLQQPQYQPQQRTYAPPPLPSNAGLSQGMQVTLNQANDLDLGQLEKVLNSFGPQG